jgi:hypothetical protein
MFCRVAYVEFIEKDAFEKALELNGSSYEGSTLVVNDAAQPPSRPAAGGGGVRSNSAYNLFVRGFDSLRTEKSEYFFQYKVM